MPRKSPPSLSPDVVRVAAWLAAEPPPVYLGTVLSPHAAVAMVVPHLTADDGSCLDHERIVVLALGSGGRVLDIVTLTTGSNRHCIVDSAQVYRWTLTRQWPVTSIILAHNHPSGDPTPSQPDVEVTRRVAQAGNMLGIALLDHLVIGSSGRYTSLAERGDIPSFAASRDYTG